MGWWDGEMEREGWDGGMVRWRGKGGEMMR